MDKAEDSTRQISIIFAPTAVMVLLIVINGAMYWMKRREQVLTAQELPEMPRHAHVSYSAIPPQNSKPEPFKGLEIKAGNTPMP